MKTGFKNWHFTMKKTSQNLQEKQLGAITFRMQAHSYIQEKCHPYRDTTEEN